jgi:hypothetical protein
LLAGRKPVPYALACDALAAGADDDCALANDAKLSAISLGAYGCGPGLGAGVSERGE